MKKSILFSLAFGAMLVATVACNTPAQQNQVTNEPVAQTTAATSGEIVFIQMDTLINNYDMFNDLRSQLESKFNTIQNDLNKKGRAFENDVKDFQDKMTKGLLTRSQAETQQNELLKREQELQLFTQQKQVEMAEEETVMVNRVMDAIKTFVASYNETHQYAMILTTSVSVNTVLAADPSRDITQDVLKGLNEEYIKNRKK